MESIRIDDSPNYYAVIPAEVRYDKNLKDKAKLLYGEISALCNKNGICWASNSYFANLYGVSNTTISTLIKNLVDRGYIETEIIYREGTKEILNRYLKIFKDPYLKNFKYPMQKNLKDNNTSINNTSINIKENIKRKVFKKPTLEELREYCISASLSVDYQYFYDYYESNGWKVGKNLMKDWKATLRNWNRRNNQNKKEISNNYEVGKIYEYDGVKYTFDKEGKKCILNSQ